MPQFGGRLKSGGRTIHIAAGIGRFGLAAPVTPAAALGYAVLIWAGRRKVAGG